MGTSVIIAVSTIIFVYDTLLIVFNVHIFQQWCEELKLQLLRFSRQIASGMVYLSKKAFVHRALVARNILLDEALTCKVSMQNDVSVFKSPDIMDCSLKYFYCY